MHHECKRRLISDNPSLRAKTSHAESRVHMWDRKRSAEWSTINSQLRNEHRKLLNKSKLEMSENQPNIKDINQKTLNLKENPNEYILISSCNF